jgi:hypothetical protein
MQSDASLYCIDRLIDIHYSAEYEETNSTLFAEMS